MIYIKKKKVIGIQTSADFFFGLKNMCKGLLYNIKTYESNTRRMLMPRLVKHNHLRVSPFKDYNTKSDPCYSITIVVLHSFICKCFDRARTPVVCIF